MFLQNKTDELQFINDYKTELKIPLKTTNNGILPNYTSVETKQLNLRKLFPNEANDFTPWLTQNNIIKTILYHLEDKEFNFWKKEIKVGDYRMDMIYQSKDKEMSYIVENQYGLSDNKHFGQIIMYRYLSRIPNILWICDEVSNEYQHIINDLKDINCILSSVEIHAINNIKKKEKYYQLIFKTQSKKHKSKIFVFECDKDLKNVTLKEII